MNVSAWVLIFFLGFLVYKNASGKILYKKLTSLPDDSYLLLDVRSYQEVIEGMLEGAVHIPVNNLREKIKLLDKTKPIYIYCASGGRAAYATSFLKKEGFKVKNIGGYAALK